MFPLAPSTSRQAQGCRPWNAHTHTHTGILKYTHIHTQTHTGTHTHRYTHTYTHRHTTQGTQARARCVSRPTFLGLAAAGLSSGVTAVAVCPAPGALAAGAWAAPLGTCCMYTCTNNGTGGPRALWACGPHDGRRMGSKTGDEWGACEVVRRSAAQEQTGQAFYPDALVPLVQFL